MTQTNQHVFTCCKDCANLKSISKMQYFNLGPPPQPHHPSPHPPFRFTDNSNMQRRIKGGRRSRAPHLKGKIAKLQNLYQSSRTKPLKKSVTDIGGADKVIRASPTFGKNVSFFMSVITEENLQAFIPLPPPPLNWRPLSVAVILGGAAGLLGLIHVGISNIYIY